MIERVRGVPENPKNLPLHRENIPAFGRTFEEELTFSIHARRRLEERAIPL